MKNINLLGVIVVVIFFLASCSVPTERVVKVYDVEISGFVGKYIDIVDGEYMFTNDGKDGFITVEFELIAKPKEILCVDYVYGGLRINATGINKVIYNTGTYGFKTERIERKKIMDLINIGNIGDKKSVSFLWDYFGLSSSKEIRKKVYNEAISLEVLDNESFIFCSQKENESSNSSSSNYSSSSNNWDKVLDSYEDYIDNYIKLLKKANDGDVSALTEYVKMMEDATDLAEKLDNASDELTAKQMTKFLKLQTKLVDSASGM